jgi:hypothetical protein
LNGPFFLFKAWSDRGSDDAKNGEEYLKMSGWMTQRKFPAPM